MHLSSAVHCCHVVDNNTMNVSTTENWCPWYKPCGVNGNVVVDCWLCCVQVRSLSEDGTCMDTVSGEV